MFSISNVFISHVMCFVDAKLLPALPAVSPPVKEGEAGYKDWVFINYTYKRFEGLTQRGVIRP